MTVRLRWARLKRDHVKYVLKSGLALLPGAISHGAVGGADKLAISRYLGRAALGAYSVAHSIGIGLTFLTGGLSSALFPWMTRKIKNGENRLIGDTVLKIFSILGALTVILVGLSPEAMALLTPQSYSVSLPAIFPIALSVLPSFLCSVVGLWAVAEEQSYKTSAYQIAGGISNLILNVLLVPRYGYLGAGLSLLISYVQSFLIGYFISTEKVREFLSPGSILAISLITVVECAAMCLAYPYLSIRILLLSLPIYTILKEGVGMKSLLVEPAKEAT
jgi:O-antigen/teichoic acid export membrane protein